MTEERAKKVLQEQIDRYGQEYDAEGIEALETAIKALEAQKNIANENIEQTSWVVGKDGAKVAFLDMPVDKAIQICEILDSDMREPTEEERRSTTKYVDSISQPTGLTVYEVDYREPEFNVKEWLSSFNTNSATVCFTEIQELKKKVEKENE